MRKKLLPWLIPLSLIVLAAGYYIYNYVTFVHTPSPLTEKEKRMVDTLFAITKTQCVGRFVFEVPDSFENTQTERARINEIQITSKRSYRPPFEQRIQRREQELQSELTVRKIDQPFLKQVYRLSENAVIFDRNRNGSEAAYGRTLEGHLYVDGVAFILSQDIVDFSDHKYQKDKEDFIRAGVDANFLDTKPAKLAELKDLMSRLSGRSNDQIPTQPGTCIAEGFIRDTGAQQQKDITFVYPHNSVFSLSVSTNTYLGGPESMLERSDEIQPYLTAIKARTLRKGKTQIAGLEADEWLNTAPSLPPPHAPSRQLLFNIIANEKTADFKHPIIDLTLSNHALPTPAYSDSELIEIWDRITRSFRIRENAF